MARGKVGELSLPQNESPRLPRLGCMGIQYSSGRDLFIQEILFSETPIHDTPKGFDVFGPSIPVIDVVGVFPDVAGENSFPAFRHRSPGIARLTMAMEASLFLTSHAHPDQKESRAFWVNSVLKLSNEPKVELIALLKSPFGCPPRWFEQFQ